MNKTITTLTLILLCTLAGLGISCSDETTGPVGASLIGDWNWVESCGGFAGQCYSPKTSGNTRTLEFTIGQVYLEFEDGRLVYTGSYKIKRIDRTIFDKTMSAVIMSGRPCDQLLITLTADELELVDNCMDGFSNRYERIH